MTSERNKREKERKSMRWRDIIRMEDKKGGVEIEWIKASMRTEHIMNDKREK